MRDQAVREQLVEGRRDAVPFPPPAPPNRRYLEPVELARWVESHRDDLIERWLAGVRGRDNGWSEGLDDLMKAFFELLVSMLPGSLGPLHDQVEPLWVQTAELFGSVASRRGLAAGEVIEEFQLFREVLIRLLFDDPPQNGAARLSLRDVLRLNRIVDRGVTYASVGHTDALFFALFQGSGIPEPPDGELQQEVRDQLQAIRKELAEVDRALAR